MTTSDDCYFWIDEKKPEDEQCMNVSCVKCNENFPGRGWFWKGSVKGYGPYEIVCDDCQRIIHTPIK